MIGLGRMGRPIAENLLKKGFSITVFARKASIQKEMKSIGADVAPTPAEMAKNSEITLLAVTDSKAVGELIFGPDGIAAAAFRGTIIID